MVKGLKNEIGVCEDENMRMESVFIRIRDFTEDDLKHILKSLTDDRVLEYYEGRDVSFTMDMVAEHFLEEIPDGFRVIIEYKVAG